MADPDASARRGPAPTSELPRWCLPVLLVAFLALVVLAGPSPLFLGVVAAVIAAVVLGIVGLHARSRQQRRAAAARPPMADIGWDATHDRLAEPVRALEAQGYLVAVAGRQARTPIVLLVDRDGSVACVVRSRFARSAWVTLSTCLVPDQQWLVTHRGLMPAIETHMLGDVVPGRPSVAELVDRHREARAVLRSHGVRLLPVRARDAAADLADRVRTQADVTVPIVRAAPTEAERHQRLPQLDGWDARLDLLRRQQAALPGAADHAVPHAPPTSWPGVTGR